MKLFLNNLIKGLMTALVVICLGGFISLNISVPSTPAMFLVSSSLINAINTNSSDNIGDGEIDINEENLVEKDEVIKQEIEEEKLEIKEESRQEENNSTNTNNENNVVQDSQNKEEDNITDKENNSNDNSNTNLEKEETIVVKGEYNPNLEVVSTIEPIETYHGKMTGYGPDCYGCSGITASGMNVLNGNIYYNDNTFGNIRIVAGDKSIPFGSIIKITGINISSEPVIAIVLDRGGMIGFQEGKHSYFDLLYETEQAASSFGRQDATFELLRSGY